MIRPEVLASERPYGPWSCRGSDIWSTFCAARDGDLKTLHHLLERDPNLRRAEYWYTQPLHFAVREGQLEAVRILLDSGADPAWVGLGGDDLATLALDRGHRQVAALLQARRRDRDPRATARPAGGGSPIHPAAREGDVARLRDLLDADPELLTAADRRGLTPLHAAVEASQTEAVAFLLERGADPNHPEGPHAPRGAALHAASRAGNRGLVELLLAHGADPNAEIDSAGSATYAAATPELRAVLITHGGELDPYDLVFLHQDDAALDRVIANPDTASAGCGGVLAAACKLRKRELVVRLLEIGVRVPPTLTECRSYLWSDPELLELLLASGMDPDLPDWQHATPLHSLCERDGRGRPRRHRIACADSLLDAGATTSTRDEDFRSTPLAWAARNGLVDMVELLLARGVPTHLADDEPWATPLSWARRRGHEPIAARLRAAGASA